MNMVMKTRCKGVMLSSDYTEEIRAAMAVVAVMSQGGSRTDYPLSTCQVPGPIGSQEGIVSHMTHSHMSHVPGPI